MSQADKDVGEHSDRSDACDLCLQLRQLLFLLQNSKNHYNYFIIVISLIQDQFQISVKNTTYFFFQILHAFLCLHCFILQLSKLNLREKLGEKHDQKKLKIFFFFWNGARRFFFHFFYKKYLQLNSAHWLLPHGMCYSHYLSKVCNSSIKTSLQTPLWQWGLQITWGIIVSQRHKDNMQANFSFLLYILTVLLLIPL